MNLLLLALVWLFVLLAVLAAVLSWLYRTKRLEVASKFTLSDVATFVSVLLAIFALAFTLALQHEPKPRVQTSARQSLRRDAVEVQLREGETGELKFRRGAGRLFFLLRR